MHLDAFDSAWQGCGSRVLTRHVIRDVPQGGEVEERAGRAGEREGEKREGGGKREGKERARKRGRGKRVVTGG